MVQKTCDHGDFAANVGISPGPTNNATAAPSDSTISKSRHGAFEVMAPSDPKQFQQDVMGSMSGMSNNF